jgi:hypothetical protein
MASQRNRHRGDEEAHKKRSTGAARQRVAVGDLLLRRSDFQIRLAGSARERQESSTLAGRRYRWRGYRAPAQTHSLGTRDGLTLQACSGETVFGTLDVCFDWGAKLPADALYRREIDAHRTGGAGACQMTRLAVDPELGSKQVLGALFHVAYFLAGPVGHASHAFIEVNPRHVSFYRRALGFTQAGETKMCTRVQALAVLMHLSAADAADQIARYAGRAPGTTRSLYPYFCSESENVQLARRITALEALS